MDPFDGVRDINSKLIKSVGKAANRFNEDSLRVLRALRFASITGFAIEASTNTAIFSCIDLLHNISKERIQAEMNKLLVGKYSKAVLAEYSDVFAEIIPQIKPSIGFVQKSKYHDCDVYEHTLKVVEDIEDASARTNITLLSSQLSALK